MEVEKEADAFGEEFANRHKDDKIHYFVGLGTSMVPHILMQCVIGKNSIGFVQNLSTVQNFSMEC